MADIAKLGMEVDSRQVRGAERDLDKFSKAGGRAEKSAKRVTRATDFLSGAMGGLKAGIVAATVAFVSFQGISKATDLSLNFGAAISEVSTLTGTAGGVIEDVEKSARSLAIQFGTFPKEQVAAFYQAFSAGANGAKEATELLTAANVLAVAGVSDVATSVQILSGVVNAYGSAVITVSDASDILFTGVKVGVTNMSLLSGAIGTVIPVSNALGISFGDTVATIAAMTTQSMTTSQATTSLAAALTSVIKPSEQASDLAKSLGLEFNAQGLAALGLKGFLEGVIEKTGGSAEKMALLFGSVEATKGILALAGEGAQKLTDSFDAMENRVGATRVAFGLMSKNELFRLNRSMSFFGDKVLSIGQSLTSVLVPTLEMIVQHFNLLAGIATVVAGVFITKLAVSVGVTFVAAVASAVTSTIALEVALGATSTAAALASASTKLFSRSLIFLRGALFATGIGALIIGAGFLVGKFFDLVKASGSFGNAVKIVADVAKESFDRMILKGQSLVVSWKIWMNDISFAFTVWSGNMKFSFFGMIDSFNSALNSTFNLKLATDNAEKSMDATAKKMSKVTDELGVLISKQSELDAALAKPMETLGELTDLLAKNKEETEGNTTATASMAKELEDLGEKGPEALKEVSKATDKLKDAVGSVADAWGEFVVDGFRNFKGFASSVLGTFRNLLVQMIAMAAKNRIIIGLGIGGSGVGGAVSAATGGGGGGVSILGGLVKSLGAIGSAFTSGIIGTIGGALSVGAAGTGILGSIGGFISGGLSTAFSGVTAGLATGGLAGIATAIGSVIPVIGAIFAVVSIGKKLFGRSLKDSGIQGTFDYLEGLEASTFQFFKGGLFRSNKTTYSPLEDAVKGPMEDAFRIMSDNVIDLATSLNVLPDFKDFSFTFRLSTAGLSPEKAQEEFQKLILSMGDDMADMVADLGDFSQSGETSLETLQRLGGGLAVVNDIFRDLGFVLKDASLAGGQAAGTFADLFGGLEQFASSTASFYANFYTQAERTENATRSMTEALAELGVDILPRSRGAFRDLVENAMGVGDESLAASLIMLSANFSDLISTTEQAATATDTLNRAESLYATKQEEVFARAGILGGYSKRSPTTRTDDVETQSLLRELLTAIKTGNINISRNTSKTAQLLERIELNPT